MWKNSKTLSSKPVLDHPRMHVVEDEVQLPDGTITQYLKLRDDEKFPVTVIAKRDDGKILMLEEFFYPPKEELLQFPGGFSKPGESPLDIARRELLEEAGFEARVWQDLGWYYMDARRSTMKMYVFAASGLIQKNVSRDKEEDIEMDWLSESDVDEKVKNHEITNVQVIAGWGMYKQAFKEIG